MELLTIYTFSGCFGFNAYFSHKFMNLSTCPETKVGKNLEGIQVKTSYLPILTLIFYNVSFNRSV